LRLRAFALEVEVMTRELRRAARVLKQGGIVAYATEYCFGLGCDPRKRDAVHRLLRLKRRSQSKGLIVIGADIEQLSPYVVEFPRAALASWPGPHTWLVSASAFAPHWLTGGRPNIAVRVTAHAQAAALCRAAGMAIVSTSANRAGAAPVRHYREALRRFGGQIDFVLPGRVGDLPAPTPIRDAASGAVIRSGK
jgi:L-threonylcarbamoyladenylate synthase